MKVVIRVDASIKIGAGHVMRCLTVAESLREKGAEVTFVSREHEGHLNDKILSRGFKVKSLPLGSAFMTNEDHPVHFAWLGENLLNEIQRVQSILEEIRPDFLIVDHYALDERWESAMREFVRNILVIDDLADRKHDCDILHDQTYGREVGDYLGLVPPDCELLLGTQYALLRPEFREWREYSLKRRVAPELKEVMISMGGVDSKNYTGRVLEALKKGTSVQTLKFTIVLGKNAPHLKAVQEILSSLPFIATVLSDVDNIAELMAKSDLAIGAPGSTSWERCCLGVPSILLVLAENQRTIASNLDTEGIAVISSDVNTICLEIDKVKKNSYLKTLSHRSSQVVDGLGVRRVLRVIYSNTVIALKPAIKEECRFFYNLQNIPGVRDFSRVQNIPTWEEHCEWYVNILGDKDRKLFKIVMGKFDVGLLRLDDLKSGAPEISILVDPKYAGIGVASRAIKLALQMGYHSFKATVKKENKISMNLFQSLGFEISSSFNDFNELKYAFEK